MDIENGFVNIFQELNYARIHNLRNTLRSAGNLYLNSTPATIFFFLTLPFQPSQSSQPGTTLLGVAVEPKFNHVLTYLMIPSIFSLGGPVGEAFPCLDTKEGIKKKELVSIGI